MRAWLGLILALFSGGALADGIGGGPGLTPQGTIVLGNCIKFGATKFKAADAGFPCFGGASSFATSPNPGVSLNPTAGTALTAKRSDEVLALDQAAAYAFTGLGKTVISQAAANNTPLTISGGSITGSSTVSPGISVTGTLNTSGIVSGAVLFANITNTASAAASKMIDLQVGSTSVFNLMGFTANTGAASLNINSPGNNSNVVYTAANGSGQSTNFGINSVGQGFLSASLGWQLFENGTNGVANLTIPANNTFQLGKDNAASPVAQTLQAQGSRAGTDSNVGGANLTIASGTGTGSGAFSSIPFQTPCTNGGTATTAQTICTGFTVKNGTAITAGYTVSTLPSTHVAGARAHVTDQTASCPAVGAALTGGGAVTCPVFDNGSAWVGG